MVVIARNRTRLLQRVLRAFRAPELMFTPRTYDAVATDLWSTGVLLANFFAPLTLMLEADDWDEKEYDDSDEGEEGATSTASLQHYIYPKQIPATSLGGSWVRTPIFDASKGEIGLLWSIFKILGTPNEVSWPVSDSQSFSLSTQP